MTAGEIPSCHWLAGSCLGVSCRFWHPACSGQRELNLLEGFAAWCAMASLDPEQRQRSVHDPAFQTLVTTAPPSISRPLLRELDAAQQEALLTHLALSASGDSPEGMLPLARVVALLVDEGVAQALLARVAQDNPVLGRRLSRLAWWRSVDWVFLDDEAAVLALLDDQDLALLLTCGVPAMRERVASLLGREGRERLPTLPVPTSQAAEKQALDDLDLRLRALLAALAETGRITVALPGYVRLTEAEQTVW